MTKIRILKYIMLIIAVFYTASLFSIAYVPDALKVVLTYLNVLTYKI